ncbi:MAG TPA: MATE family efflux transporter [Gemmatimonadaceae bacterium]|nr:MATE family efflux transporter [Gemmatimonadaceae bacterium]
MGSREGLAPVAVTAEHAAVELVTAGDLPRAIRRIALPAVASNLLMTLFASVDAYWVGTRVGAAGLAAVSTAIFWVWMIVALAEMVGVGVTAVAARRHGERRRAEAARVVGDALLLALALGTLVAVVGAHLVPWLFAVMHTPPDVSALGRAYLATYLLGAPLLYGFFAVDAGFRAAGDTRTPFVLLAASVAVTLVLDPLLILGAWGLPRLGIAGAAVATVATRGAVFLMGVAILHRRGLVRVGRPRTATVAAICRVGLPTALTGSFFSIIYVLLTRTTTHFGTPALAALGLGHRVESWLYMMAVGFGAAAAAAVGQNLGAGRADRAARAGWVSVGYALLPAFVLAALMLAVPATLAGAFTRDAVVVAETARYLRIAAVAQLVLCVEVVLEGALGGAGDTVPPMLASTTLTASRLPLAAWSAARWGVVGIWWTITLTAVARAVAMALLWRSGRWRHRSL